MVFKGGASLLKYKGGQVLKQSLSAASETVSAGIYDATTLSTVDADFVSPNGVVDLKTGKAQFNFTTVRPLETQAAKEFQIAIRKNSPTGQIIFTSGVVTLRPYTFVVQELFDYMSMLYHKSCLFNPQIEITPESLFLAREEC